MQTHSMQKATNLGPFGAYFSLEDPKTGKSCFSVGTLSLIKAILLWLASFKNKTLTHFFFWPILKDTLLQAFSLKKKKSHHTTPSNATTSDFHAYMFSEINFPCVHTSHLSPTPSVHRTWPHILYLTFSLYSPRVFLFWLRLKNMKQNVGIFILLPAVR